MFITEALMGIAVIERVCQSKPEAVSEAVQLLEIALDGGRERDTTEARNEAWRRLAALVSAREE